MSLEVLLANLYLTYNIIPLIFFSLLTRYLISINNQNWIRTFSGSATLILLPIVTYSITSVISGNIALSLGMIGALSIVRFRNPVRSSFELVIFFLMISLGICAAAGIKWLFILGFTSNAILFGIFLTNFLSKKHLNRDIFLKSFSEGNSLSTLEVTSSVEIDDLLKNEFLSAYMTSSGKHIYRLASDQNLYLINLSKDIKSFEGIEEVKFLSS